MFMKGIITSIIKGKKSDGQDTIGKVAEEVADVVQGFNPAEQATKRHSGDMLSDSQLSKSVRPIAIIWLLALFTAALIMNWTGHKTDEQFQEIIFWGLIIVLGFYFPGRDLVKTFTNRKK